MGSWLVLLLDGGAFLLLFTTFLSPDRTSFCHSWAHRLAHHTSAILSKICNIINGLSLHQRLVKLGPTFKLCVFLVCLEKRLLKLLIGR